MDYAAFTTALNTTLGDSGDVTFTSGEKTRALDKAFNDDYVNETNWDASIPFVASTYRYALPASIDVVQDVYYRPSTSDFPSPISSDCWEIIDSQLSLTPLAKRYFVAGDTIFLRGKNKITKSDTVTSVGLQEYIIALAGYNTLTLLAYKKVNLFLKNDTTIGELVTLRRELREEVREYRNRRMREWENA